MIFISACGPESVVFFAPLEPQPPFGELMKKSATLITTALLTFGFAAASMAADMPKTAAPTAADTAAPAPAPKAHKKSTAKKHKKATTTAPATGK
jgi:hypothetical protein